MRAKLGSPGVNPEPRQARDLPSPLDLPQTSQLADFDSSSVLSLVSSSPLRVSVCRTPSSASLYSIDASLFISIAY